MSEVQDALSRAVLKLALMRRQTKSVKEKFADFKDNDRLYQRLTTGLQLAKDAQEADEAGIREMALEIYEEIGEKKLHPAITIKEYKGFDYDQTEMHDYVEEHLPALMEVDWKALEAYLKTAKKLPPGVIATTTTKPTIKTNLDEYLEEAESEFGLGGEKSEK